MTRVEQVGPQMRSVTSLVRHEPVLLALKQMSGRDFGFDQQAWRRWWDADGRQLVGNESDLLLLEPPAVKQAQPLQRERADTPKD